MGSEFRPYSKYDFVPMWQIKALVSRDICVNFFEKLTDRMCLNTDFNVNADTLETKQWCWVSPNCTELNGGYGMGPGNTGVKYCTSGKDNMAQDWTMDDLVKMRNEHKVSIGMLARWAYPTWQGLAWPVVKQFWTNRSAAKENDLFPDEFEAMQRLVDSGKPMIFNSGNPMPSKDDIPTWDAHAPWSPGYALVMGSKAYELGRPDNFENMWASGDFDLIRD